MKEQIDNTVTWVKEVAEREGVKGCITGSIMAGYFEGQDVDVFCYDEKSFNKLLAACKYDSMMNILDATEKRKLKRYLDKPGDPFKAFGLVTIKYTYNTCVNVNIILKKRKENLYSVLASFDLDIVSIGYDLETKKTLDLSENLDGKVATWNRYNTAYYSPDIWAASRILRQMTRCFKYHERGYNVDQIIIKYIDIIDNIPEFKEKNYPDTFKEVLVLKKKITRTLKGICEAWLETHLITGKQLEHIEKLIKEI